MLLAQSVPLPGFTQDGHAAPDEHPRPPWEKYFLRLPHGALEPEAKQSITGLGSNTTD